jgi:hypothetical protein
MTGSWYVAQADLELAVLLLQPSKGWDYRYAPLCLTQFFLLNANNTTNFIYSRALAISHKCRYLFSFDSMNI